VVFVTGEYPAGEIAEVDEQAQAGQPLGKVAGLSGVGVVASVTDQPEVCFT
jgi:hypothetical protein